MKTTENMKLHCLSRINYAAKLFAALKQTAYDNGDYEAVRKCKELQILSYLAKSLTILDLEESGHLSRTQRVAEKTGYLLQEFSYVADDGIVRLFHSPSQNQSLENGEIVGQFNGYGRREKELRCNRNSEGQIEILCSRKGSAKKMIYLPYLNYLIKNLSPKYKVVYDFISEDICRDYSKKVDEFFELLESCGINGEVVDCHSYRYTDYTQFKMNLYGNGIRLCPYEIIFNDREQDELIIAVDENGFLYCDMWVG